MCFERYLARKLGNALYPPHARVVTAQDLRGAQSRDQANASSFRKDYEAHVAAGLSFAGRHAATEELAAFFKNSLEMMERASAIGGSWTREMAALESSMEAAKTLLIEITDDPKPTDLLQRFEALHSMSIDIPLVAQLGLADGPFKGDTDEWLRAVLSEDDWQIERCGLWAGAMGVQILNRAEGICAQAIREGYPSFEARRKLGLMREGFEEGKKLGKNAEKKI